MKKKMLGVLLTGIMAMAVLGGCGKKEAESEAPATDTAFAPHLFPYSAHSLRDLPLESAYRKPAAKLSPAHLVPTHFTFFSAGIQHFPSALSR